MKATAAKASISHNNIMAYKQEEKQSIRFVHLLANCTMKSLHLPFNGSRILLSADAKLLFVSDDSNEKVRLNGTLYMTSIIAKASWNVTLDYFHWTVNLLMIRIAFSHISSLLLLEYFFHFIVTY